MFRRLFSPDVSTFQKQHFDFQVHETRSLDQNRKIARLRLRQKLDQYLNKENSQREILKRQASANRKIKKRKTNERLEKLRAFKEREGLS